jgi:SAM-dependent methyltransferase
VNTRDKKNFSAVLKSLECRELYSLINPLSVNHFVEITHGGYALSVSPAKAKLRLCLGNKPPSGTSTGEFIIADPSELPLRPEGIDMVLLTHVLEFVSLPQLILREIYQTLAPQGLLYVIGFNPMSLLGLSKYFHVQDEWPYTGKFLTIPHVLKDARSVGFAVLHFKTFAFYYSRRHAKLNDRLLFLEPLGQFLAPSFCGIYYIVLQKNVLGTVNVAEHAKKRKAVNVVDNYI